MTQRPGFFFYPGDYLRDTQCLSEPVQVAYDRIMCEHMRNICISQQRLNFFTKKLNADEIAELLTVLKTVDGGFQITWVAESISKYEAYRQSRSKNRASKKDKDIIDTSSTYVQHMESESEIEEESEKKNTDRGVGKGIAVNMVQVFKTHFPEYPVDQKLDFTACLEIAYKIADSKGWPKESVVNGKMQAVTDEWSKLVVFALGDKWYCTRAISDLNKEFQRLTQSANNGTAHQRSNGTTAPHVKNITGGDSRNF